MPPKKRKQDTISKPAKRGQKKKNDDDNKMQEPVITPVKRGRKKKEPVKKTLNNKSDKNTSVLNDDDEALDNSQRKTDDEARDDDYENGDSEIKNDNDDKIDSDNGIEVIQKPAAALAKPKPLISKLLETSDDGNFRFKVIFDII